MNDSIGYSKEKFLGTYGVVRKKATMVFYVFVVITGIEVLLILLGLTPVRIAGVHIDPITILVCTALFFYMIYLWILIIGHMGTAERCRINIIDGRLIYVKLISISRNNSRDSRYEIRSVRDYYISGLYIYVEGDIVDNRYFNDRLISSNPVSQIKIYNVLANTEGLFNILEMKKQNKNL